ncbi:hypothetical protein D0962_11210 [Leptolyngbyaceae cyanobacterium CCMR0082]|uniref:Uncharacterized protein n=2 Tax=Adonisia turfae TaxID=2950184 RepID=A0A6M0S4E4_9CYAN|nr:hypothetical protein [Adonisia turfae]EKV01951.1 hypothetical protein Lepto7375DRAFT_4146 [Leptolyngbya sp. PCC 7375]MDV3350495.1 hypothetical protein [Leptothoe sp. LEGE 181152]NEZ55672.1 hypothetical protein [Adonisia turfae CCMR0081]NEZ63347.1 hypothetical protein [Adonisia turfae CCMR0082]
MQHLAKVCHTTSEGAPVLQFLARQLEDYLWELSIGDQEVVSTLPVTFNEGTLVLVELDASNQVVDIQEATDWILDLVSQFLTQGVTPQFFHQEVERAEQWRQSLTLQSQEIRRRALETAARRDEIQALEKKLRLEQEEIERQNETQSTQ